MELLNERKELMGKCLEAATYLYMDLKGVGEYDDTEDVAIAHIAVALFNDARESERRTK